MDLNNKSSELEIFLYDISEYLKNELQLFQYENTLLEFSELKCKDLLMRCEKLLKGNETKESAENCHSQQLTSKLIDLEVEESSYLDMSATRKATSCDYIDLIGTLKDVDTNNHEDTDDKEIYDTCNTSLEPTIKPTTDENETLDCPYIELPASHLNNIHKPSKQGQLIQIEKRIFFDQTKKLYCGIVKDWLLCYGEGLSSVRPLFCVKLNKIEIEHTGEGKRRDLCFQIINTDTGKRFVFQATSDIDSKEWIHAIEAAIRGDFNAVNNIHESPKIVKSFNTDNNSRKLPTPPVQNKIYAPNDTLNEDIYEEPCPLYMNSNVTTENIKIETDEIPPMLPIKTDRSQKTNNIVSDYDVPKKLSPIRTCSETSTTIAAADALRNKTEFRNKVKDVHSKLTNHLSSGPSPAKPKKLPELSPTTNVIKSPSKLPLIKDKAAVSLSPDKGSTPVKNWFFNRLKSSTAPGNTFNYSSKSSPNKQEKENFLSNNNAINLDCPKGGKVNMIINHLEANGHMPIFKGNLERLNSSLVDNIDDCNYEPIMASSNLKS